MTIQSDVFGARINWGLELARDLAAYFPLSDNAALGAVDLVSGAIADNFSVIQNWNWTPGPYGVNYNPSNAASPHGFIVSVPMAAGTDGTHAFRFNCGDVTATQRPVSHGNGGTAGNDLAAQIYDSGIRAIVNQNTPYVTGTTPISSNTWYHCAVTVNSTNVKIYLDGIKRIDEEHETSGIVGFLSYGIGCRPTVTGVEAYGGHLREVGLWRRELADTEIMELAQNQNALTSPSFSHGGLLEQILAALRTRRWLAAFTRRGRF
jgi:hypothetical protein